MHGRRGFLASLLAVPIVARLSGPAHPAYSMRTDEHVAVPGFVTMGIHDGSEYGDTIFINAQYDARTATVVPSK